MPIFVCLFTVNSAPKKQFIARNIYVELMGKSHRLVQAFAKANCSHWKCYNLLPTSSNKSGYYIANDTSFTDTDYLG